VTGWGIVLGLRTELKPQRGGWKLWSLWSPVCHSCPTFSWHASLYNYLGALSFGCAIFHSCSYLRMTSPFRVKVLIGQQLMVIKFQGEAGRLKHSIMARLTPCPSITQMFTSLLYALREHYFLSIGIRRKSRGAHSTTFEYNSSGNMAGKTYLKQWICSAFEHFDQK